MLPSVTPHHPRIRYLWPADPESSTVGALDELARRVVRLGHASSLVACRALSVGDGERDALHVYQPDDAGEVTLRTVTPGQLARLEHAYLQHRAVEPRILPARHQGYRRGTDRAAGAARPVFGEWLVLREVAPTGGRRLGLRLSRTEDIARAMRGALLRHADDPPPAALSGHTPEGSPLDRPHVAFVSLADVGSKHAGGAIIGCAVILPGDVGDADRRAVLRAIGRWEQNGLRLAMGRAGVVQLERVIDRDPRSTLDPATWARPARRWGSVTAVALDENPGNLHARDPITAAAAADRAEDIVARSCERIGLPRPKWVEVMRRSLFDAAPPARHFSPFPRHGRGPTRVCVHVELCFTEPVAGPVLIGAGRYFGLGLCRARQEDR